jgi:hypothetical protein
MNKDELLNLAKSVKLEELEAAGNDIVSARELYGSYYEVSGGPLARPTKMGWQLMDSRGMTNGVACTPLHHRYLQRHSVVTLAEAVIELLSKETPDT